jgi:hypothetical protein
MPDAAQLCCSHLGYSMTGMIDFAYGEDNYKDKSITVACQL